MTVVLEVLIAVRNALPLAVRFVAAWAFIDIRRMNKHYKIWKTWFRDGYYEGEPEPIYHHTWPLRRMTL